MCKIMTITGIDPTKSKELYRFVRAARPELTKTEPHGFGYIALNRNGMFGERWVNVADSFKNRTPVTDADKMLMEELGASIYYPEEYGGFGKISARLEGVTTIALHARTSTNTINLRNTHPFYYDGYALIHNGVIQNHHELTKKISTCDSESILHEYLDNGVAQDIKKMQAVHDTLRGYYACAVMGFDGERWHLDVFKDDRASLCFAVIPELGNAKVWTTCEFTLQRALAKAKFGHAKIFKVMPNYIVRLDAVTGKCIDYLEFEDTAKVYSMPVQSKFNAPETAGIPEYREDANETATADEDEIIERLIADSLDTNESDEDVYERIQNTMSRFKS